MTKGKRAPDNILGILVGDCYNLHEIEITVEDESVVFILMSAQ